MIRKLMMAGATSLLLVSSAAMAQQRTAPDPANGARSRLIPQEQNETDAKSALMMRFMGVALPFADYQVIHYKDEVTGEEIGTGIRKGLEIRFRDKTGNFVGVAKRRSQANTAYYDADGNFLGLRVYQLQTMQKQIVRVRPGDAARQRPAELD